MMSIRLEKLRHRLRTLKCDAIIVSNITNVRYLTGFTGTAGLVVVTPVEAWFFTDFRYEAQAGEEIEGFKVLIEKRGLLRAAAMRIRRRGFDAAALETHCVTVDQREELSGIAPKVTWISGKRVIEKLREVKDTDEIATLRRAIEITDCALAEVLHDLRPGVTEREVALLLEETLVNLGADGKSFETIIASGVRSAMPHGVASHKKLEKGDLVTIDFGGKYQGYCADLTRTVCLGRSTSEQRRLYSLVRTAQLRAEDGLRSGVSGKCVDGIARDYLRESGYGKEFGHGLGHGVGLDIHEAPRLSEKANQKLPSGSVVTVEPGVYLPNFGGVRIEDVAVVQADGCEILTRAPKPARLPEI